jgi:hypothetical protein
MEIIAAYCEYETMDTLSGENECIVMSVAHIVS